LADDVIEQTGRAPLHLICPTCPALPGKIFCFSETQNQAYILTVLLPIRGAFRDRHERQQRDAMDAMTCLTKHVVAYGEAVWSCPPDAGVK
jgi:hypothetical protein